MWVKVTIAGTLREGSTTTVRGHGVKAAGTRHGSTIPRGPKSYGGATIKLHNDIRTRNCKWEKLPERTCSMPTGLHGIATFPASASAAKPTNNSPLPLACVRMTGLPAAELPATLPIEGRRGDSAEKCTDEITNTAETAVTPAEQKRENIESSCIVRWVRHRLTWRPREVWRRGGCCRPRNPSPRQ